MVCFHAHIFLKRLFDQARASNSSAPFGQNIFGMMEQRDVKLRSNLKLMLQERGVRAKWDMDVAQRSGTKMAPKGKWN